MPLVRYEVWCEHSLVDPELYRKTLVRGAGGDDSSRALLEAVAVAGLVGIVRQLGDLAGLWCYRFLLACHSDANIASPVNTRSKWHSSLPYEPKSCTQGDLPHFLRHFYEECQPPPCLSLLDKICVFWCGQKCSQQGAHGTCSSEALAATSMKKRILRLVLYLTLHHHFQIMWCLRQRFLSSVRNLRKKLEHKASEDFGHQDPFWRATTT